MPLRALSLAVAWSLVTARAPATSDDRPAVLVWPDDAALRFELAELGQGDPPVPPRHAWVPTETFAGALARAQSQVVAQDAAALAAVDTGLATARQQWLAQDWDAMVSTLTALERDHLALLSDPARCDALWELEFRLALAHRGRKQADDADAAAARLAFALALQPERRPARELYGPDVLAEFLAVQEAQSARVPLPVAITTTPAHATVAVDCKPVTAGARVELRPGLHVVHARAIGHAVIAQLLWVPQTDALALTLPPLEEPDALVRLAMGTTAAPLRLAVAADRRALVQAAAARDIDVVVLVGRKDEGFTARALVGEGLGPTQRRDVLRAAVLAALEAVDEHGVLRSAAPRVQVPADREPATPTKPRKPVVRTWWFWTVIGAAVVGTSLGLGLGLGLRDREPGRLVVYGPR
ncbi:MAG: hypothetical protein K1X88_03590 [Nannocystaceae bacterium]|nr:hypothetical protein [Nannocystaceae bacterium]